MYRLREDTELTVQMIEKYIQNNQPESARREKLFNYYKGIHAIRARTLQDASKPNNKVVNPYPHYITDIMTGYFV